MKETIEQILVILEVICLTPIMLIILNGSGKEPEGKIVSIMTILSIIIAVLIMFVTWPE